MRRGAYDYLLKPLGSPEELRLLVRKALTERAQASARSDLPGGPHSPAAPGQTGTPPAAAAVREGNSRSRGIWARAQPPASGRAGRRLEAGETTVSIPGLPEPIIAVSRAMQEVLELVRLVAPTTATVLMTGQSGTGKGVIARAIHGLSPRADRPFIPVSCVAIPENLLESELFGHERGAFTGAVAQRRGRFELADGGTLFLDEVGDMSPALQARLLRVLQERQFERVGGTRTIRVDVRLVAATNRDLEQAVLERGFREDLYYRLKVFPIHLPPLRERREDILPLATTFLARVASRHHREGLRLSRATVQSLLEYAWPGNVRELEHAIERTLIVARGEEIQPENLALGVRSPGAAPTPQPGTMEEIEKAAILRALEETGGNRRLAARRLGMALRTLQYRLKSYGLTNQRPASDP
ncbi:MAG: sigma-54-dependent Fis family transcriptional regulator [Deltaproteobacteria bacterium]|nr:sigma-54-dependent Fis family transcriptional regulator [Deltaproteobacteria bacterium]MBI3078820.1 sigma-54-dependent Fis family transcriptional regulator [Deltaproteobacteria bacterium]